MGDQKRGRRPLPAWKRKVKITPRIRAWVVAEMDIRGLSYGPTIEEALIKQLKLKEPPLGKADRKMMGLPE